MSFSFADPETGLWPVLFKNANPHVIAVVGAGGKTSAVKTLAAELARAGHTVLITTTTKMHPPRDPCLLAASSEEAGQLLVRCPVAWVGVYCDEQKMEGLNGALPELINTADYVLIEADGARKHSLKMADSSHEPVIPKETEAVMAVAGLDGIGKSVSQSVHRVDMACQALACGPGHRVTTADAARLLTLSYAPQYVLLNKADTPERTELARETAAFLPEARCVAVSLRAWGLAEDRN